MTPLILPPWRSACWLRMAAFGALAVVSVPLVLAPLSRQMGRRQRQLEGLESDIRSAQHLIAEAGRARSVTPGETAQQALAQRIAPGQSVARVLEVLTAQATSRGLELTAQPPHPDAAPHQVTLGPAITLREAPLTLRLTGYYRPLGEFLQALSSAPFLCTVRRLEMTRAATFNGRLQLDVDLAVFLATGGPTP